MKVSGVLLLLAMLTGCATCQPKVVTITVPCQPPAVAAPSLEYSPDLPRLDDKVLALARDREMLLGYAVELRAAVDACRK